MSWKQSKYAQVLFVCAAFFLMTAISGFFFSNIMRRESVAGGINNLKVVEHLIYSYVHEAQAAFSTVYAGVQERINKNEPMETVDSYLAQATDLFYGLKGIVSVYGYLRGELLNVPEADTSENYVPQERPWYKLAYMKLGDTDIHRTSIYIDAFTGRPVVSLARRMYGENGDYYGVLAMDVDLAWLEGYAKSPQFTEGRYLILVSRYFQVLTHREPRYQGAKFEDIGPDYAKIANMLREGQKVSAVSIRDYDGVKTLFFFEQLYNGWFIGVAIPASGYYSNIYSSIFMLTALGIVLAAILSYTLLRLSAAKERSEQESKSKSSFLAMMSHEIRTPISAIIGIAQIELQKEGLPEEYAKALDKIYASGDTLLGIINDVLDLSKIESGKLELNPAEYDVPSLINDAAQINAVRIGSKKIDFMIDVDSGLPSKFYGDELRLRQALNNLLSNAVKYTDEGFVKLSVSSSTRGDDTLLRFCVEDSGQGIRPEDKAKLFSEYNRFNIAANRTTEGTGIGLSITRRLVEMMGGTIEAESEYGKGSKFTIGVIQKNVQCEPIGADISEKLKSFSYAADRRNRQGKISEIMPYGKVLVVDDVETNLYVAKGLLALWKINVETANSGFEALDKVVAGEVYDIIFMDHMMPKMDGIETTQKIRAHGYSGTIVALTANALIGNDEMFRQHGFDDFVPKPIDLRRLGGILNKFIRDKYPEEAKKYTAVGVGTDSARPLSDPKLLEIFRRDAETAIIALREAMKNGDIKQLAAAAHSMKPILAGVGEHEKSQMALALEKAGKNDNTDYVNANTEIFIKALEELIENLKAANGNNTPPVDDADITEDTVFLTEQLEIIKSACDDYDEAAAYQAIGRLKEKMWKNKTADAIESIYDMLFLHSDFEGAAERTLAQIR